MKKDFVIVHLPTWEDVERLSEPLGDPNADYYINPFYRFRGEEGKFCVKVCEEGLLGKYCFATWGTENNYLDYHTHVTIDEFAAMCGEKPESFQNNNLMEVLLNG